MKKTETTTRYFCDRCGSEFKNINGKGDHSVRRLNWTDYYGDLKYNPGVEYSNLDLCSACSEKFMNWWNDGRKPE